MCIISHKYKFIFIRVRKTASTSIQYALSKISGPFDTISQFDDKDISNAKHAKNNWCYILSRKAVFYNHIPAFRIREMIAYMDKGIWDNYFKFCFERNPWDKIISQYYYEHQKKVKHTRKDLNKFIMHGGLVHRSDWRLYTEEDKNDDTVIVDKVFKYEEINDAFKYLKKRVNLPVNAVMPEKRFKDWSRKDHRHYREILTNQEKERIADVFSREIKEFGFTY